MPAQREYLIPRTTRTLRVYKVTAANPTEAAMKMALLVERDQAAPITTRVLGDDFARPQVAVLDPSADADVDRSEDDQDAKRDDDAKDKPTNGAHAATVPPVDPGQTLAL